MSRADRIVTVPFTLTFTASFFVFLAIGMLLPVLPLYARGPLGVGDVGVGLAVGMSSPMALVAQPLAGRLGDRRGRRLLMVAGALVMAIAIAGYTLAGTLATLIVLRLATGVGEALVFVGSGTIVADLAPVDRRGEALSIYTIGFWGGLALGPVAGEALLGTDRFDLVWLVAAGCAVIAALVGLLLPETRPETDEPSSGKLLHPAALRPGLVLVSAVLGFAGFYTFLALYARELGLDGVGPIFLLLAVIIVGIRIVGRRLPDRLGPKRASSFALVLLASGLVVIGLWSTEVGLYAGTVVFAVGQALAFPSLMTLAVAGAPPADRSSVVGTFTAFADVGFAVGAVSLGVVANAAGYDGVFLAAAAASLAGLLVLARMPGSVRVRAAEAS
ncbi:MAG TPA: MFS transporter [Gaiellaceae bacterium]|nr:MFS transporter [Gaiellaceae bacterium]